MGITSFGPEDCLTFGQPGVYTSVSAHLDWILYIFENPSIPSRNFSHTDVNTGGPTLQLPDGADAKTPVARSLQVLGNNHCEYECELSQGTLPSDGVLYECREVRQTTQMWFAAWSTVNAPRKSLAQKNAGMLDLMGVLVQVCNRTWPCMLSSIWMVVIR